jgi:hypothetical protein
MRSNGQQASDLEHAHGAGAARQNIRSRAPWTTIQSAARTCNKADIACRTTVVLSRSVTKRQLTSGDRRRESWTGSPVEVGAMRVMAARLRGIRAGSAPGALGQATLAHSRRHLGLDRAIHRAELTGARAHRSADQWPACSSVVSACCSGGSCWCPAQPEGHVSPGHDAPENSLACGATASTPAGQIVQPWAQSAAHRWLAQCLHRYSSPRRSTRYAARTAGPHRSHASFISAFPFLARSRRSRRYAQPRRHR